MIQLKWVYTASYLYLVLPVIIFCLGWLNLLVGVGATLLFTWLIFRQIRVLFRQEDRRLAISLRQAILCILITGLWVFLSGIGGHAYQNPDFHARNAMLRDLIDHSWPVVYSLAQSNYMAPGSGPIMMVYYIGFWLPAALVGKLFGWGAANFFLFLWSWLGVALVVISITAKLKRSLVFSALLLIFFSGMDIVGRVWLNSFTHVPFDLTVWPPIYHLEWWAGPFQFSSFTTQLFWVHNQAIPAWVCMALLINGVDRKYVLFLWSLCFFLAPLPAVGMIPIVAVGILTEDPAASGRDQVPAPHNRITAAIRPFLDRILAVLTLENVVGGAGIALLSYLYFSTNITAQRSGFRMDFPVLYVASIVFEAGLLWLLLLPLHRREILWYVVGGSLLLFPLFRIGVSGDFSFRASIPALFLLMVAAADSLTRLPSAFKISILVCLIVGAVTPLYEIDRSVYRTTSYYLTRPSIPESYVSLYLGPEGLDFTPNPVTDHPYALVADELRSLGNCRMCLNFFGGTQSSFFYRYLAHHTSDPGSVTTP